MGAKGTKHGTRIKKTCPVCGVEFEVPPHQKKKVTCSRRCSNTHFRSGPNNPNWKDKNYRSTCFHYHEKKCIVCGEDRIVEVHHYDGNKDNNDPKNLVPLCPTHHQYWHSRHRYLIKEKVDNFIGGVV